MQCESEGSTAGGKRGRSSGERLRLVKRRAIRGETPRVPPRVFRRAAAAPDGRRLFRQVPLYAAICRYIPVYPTISR